MTFFEHAMLGGTLALAAGGQRRHGWPLVFTAGVAAALPDWDGLSLAFGPTAYSTAHRVWGHNVLAAGLAGAVVGGLGYLCHQSARVRRRVHGLLARRDQPPPAPPPPPPFSALGLAVWVVVGLLAGLSHLPADVIYGGSEGTTDWPVPLLWPFSPRTWAWPIVTWGDLGPTLIFIVEMFALYRWRGRATLIAWAALSAVAGYLAVRWAVAAAF